MFRDALFFFMLLLILCTTVTGQTILYPGDLAIMGLASNVGGDLGNCTPDGNGQFQGRDRVSFVCFKGIETGTAIDITDNGWERAKVGFWGNTEGFIRATRTGGFIPAGTIITFEFPPTQTNSQAVAPDEDWDFQILGTNALNFNDSGDQLYFLQGGVWTNGTIQGCCNGAQDASYTGGRILFGFNSGGAWTRLVDDSQNSALHPDVSPCFHMAPTNGVASFSSYSGPIEEATQLEWIDRLRNPGNWSAYTDCKTYQNPPAQIAIGPSGMSVSCKVCQSCGPVLDTLVFSLPVTGGPFRVAYTDGLDTFLLDNLANGHEITVDIVNSTTYELLQVTDNNGCPVYSNFETAATIVISSNRINLDVALLPAADCLVERLDLQINSIEGGSEPYSLTIAPSDLSIPVSSFPLVIPDLSPGIYTLVVTDNNGCRQETEINIPAETGQNANLNLDLGDDVLITEGQGIRLEAMVNFVPQVIFWEPQLGVSDPNSLVTVVAPVITTTYTVTAIDIRGCSASDEIQVTVIRENRIFIPNAFSPDEDGVNDFFTLFPGPEIAGVRSLKIFNRWGNLIYQAQPGGIEEIRSWDGKLPNGVNAADGVYLFFAEIVDQNGNEEVIKGSVTLIR